MILALHLAGSPYFLEIGSGTKNIVVAINAARLHGFVQLSGGLLLTTEMLVKERHWEIKTFVESVLRPNETAEITYEFNQTSKASIFELRITTTDEESDQD